MTGSREIIAMLILPSQLFYTICIKDNNIIEHLLSARHCFKYIAPSTLVLFIYG